jgi:hypothetical protein
MKKSQQWSNLLYCSLSVMIVLASCTQSSINPSEASLEVRLQLIREIETSQNSVARISYSKLTPEEKVVFWHRHLEKWMSHTSLSSAQLVYLKKVHDFATPALYADLESPAARQKIVDAENVLFHQAIKDGLFTQAQLYQIVTFEGIGTQELANGRIEAVEGNYCDCLYSISCGAGSCRTEVQCGPLYRNPYDCGILGTSRCSGHCSPQ